jgi:hypothetical protein
MMEPAGRGKGDHASYAFSTRARSVPLPRLSAPPLSRSETAR